MADSYIIDDPYATIHGEPVGEIVDVLTFETTIFYASGASLVLGVPYCMSCDNRMHEPVCPFCVEATA